MLLEATRTCALRTFPAAGMLQAPAAMARTRAAAARWKPRGTTGFDARRKETGTSDWTLGDLDPGGSGRKGRPREATGRAGRVSRKRRLPLRS